jgi:phosphatidylserine/phosphatidylglycerophosphate/cardiolipin synthase-like enzyme
MAVDGNAAEALGQLARERWRAAGGKPIEAPTAHGKLWPAQLQPAFENVDVAISRTKGAHAGEPAIREIEALFVDQIRRAKRYIYAENQYFASRVVAEAIAERLAEPDCPEIVIINSRTGFGWLDEEAMSPARERLLKTIRQADTQHRFHIYTASTAAGEDIYVHSKILIIDDQVLRVGSANMNNRSMGLDSECDLSIDTALEANRGFGENISRTLHDLLGEHLGCGATRIEQHIRGGGSLITAIEQLAGVGRRLVPLDPAKPNALESSLAERELLDPEASSEDFEPLARPGLLTGILRRRARHE